MDRFVGPFLLIAAGFLAGVAIAAIALIVQVRSGRRERLEMRQHVHRLADRWD